MNEDQNQGVEFTDSEKGYRKGFLHGFAAACAHPEISMEDIKIWGYGNEQVGPPGTILAGKYLPGLIKKEKTINKDKIKSVNESANLLYSLTKVLDEIENEELKKYCKYICSQSLEHILDFLNSQNE